MRRSGVASLADFWTRVRRDGGDRRGDVSTAFKGKTRARQHQMVYEALKGRMGGELHALALTTSES
jgi:BolA-like protein